MNVTTNKWLKWAAVLFSTVALCFSLILTWHSVTGNEIIGCGNDSGCGSVLSSRWSMLFGVIPVGALAAGLYVAVLACLMALKDKELERLASSVIVVAAGAIMGCAIWFNALQVLSLHQFCRYCNATHAFGCVAALALMAICHPKRKMLLFGGGLLLAAALAVVQSITSTSRVLKGWTEEALPSFSIKEYPHIGEADAKVVYEVLFDYQCSHCRELHGMMKEVASSHPDMAFVLCPTPLSPICNPYVPKESDRFTGSCELAKLALALWRVDEKAFETFDQWLFDIGGGDKWTPRTPEEAHQMAASLVGDDKLAEALADPWIDDSILKAAELFGRTTVGKGGGIPRIIRDGNWIIPEVSTTDELLDALEANI